MAPPSKYIPIRFQKQIIGVLFQRDATQSERQAAIDLVSGTVVGGYGAAGIYLVRIDDPGDGSRLIGACERLERIPQVSAATPDYEFGPHRMDGK